MVKDDQGLSSSTHSSISISLCSLLLTSSISYGYCYFLVKKFPKGFPRLISLLPVLYTLFLVPWYFPSSVLLRGLSSFFFSWISSFKLLLLSFDEGELALCDTYVDFVAVAVLPLKNNLNSSPSRTPIPLINVGTLAKLLAISIPFLALSLHDALRVFLFLLSMTCVGRVLKPHLEVVRILDQPHRATSVQAFWGKRWNRVGSDILRHTIYGPARRTLAGRLGIESAKAVALVAALVVSGMMHELMFYHMTCGAKPTWEVTEFFALQGVCVALEVAAKRFWVRTLGWHPLPPSVSVPPTLCFLLGTSYWLLFLPVWRIGGRACDSKGLGMELMEKSMAYVMYYPSGAYTMKYIYLMRRVLIID